MKQQSKVTLASLPSYLYIIWNICWPMQIYLVKCHSIYTTTWNSPLLENTIFAVCISNCGNF